MSKFHNLRKFLPFPEAIGIYWRLKTGRRDNMQVSRLNHPFSLRNNPHDYGTFEEVIVKESYGIQLDFIPDRIIDGGGNIGLTAAYFASLYPNTSIVSIEPDKENFDLLVKNTEAYGNIKPLQGGVWDHSAFLIVRDLGLGNNGFMVEEVSENTSGALQAWSIEDILAMMQWNGCDIIKLDVEGSEKEIFSNNYQNWLPKTKVLIVELHDRMKKGCSKAVFHAISQYNFSMEIAGENLVFRNQDAV